jgi:DMSO/TMAO reductase YedYZ molybdopterin-dependent catalytic subunit
MERSRRTFPRDAFDRVQAWSLRRDDEPRHDTRTASWLGVALGVSFTICFLTGLISHLLQHRPGWFRWPTHPAGLYRITQGLHVASGTAAIPLLLAKLWSVGHHLVRPPKRSVAEIVERLSLVPLVGGSLFLLITGVQNIDYWYAWRFYFPAAHYAAAWVTIGALIVHIGAKAGAARTALTSAPATEDDTAATAPNERRRFLGYVGGLAGVLTAVTVGRAWSPLGNLALLSSRRPGRGPHGLPVNKSAAAAHVGRIDPAAWRLRVHGAGVHERTFTLTELQALPQRRADLPIACVEGWSVAASWRGVPVREVLAAAGVHGRHAVTVRSAEVGGYSVSHLTKEEAAASNTLLAMELDGAPLHPDHGFPLRLIAPDRPGVLQTKWLVEVEVR